MSTPEPPRDEQPVAESDEVAAHAAESATASDPQQATADEGLGESAAAGPACEDGVPEASVAEPRDEAAGEPSAGSDPVDDPVADAYAAPAPEEPVEGSAVGDAERAGEVAAQPPETEPEAEAADEPPRPVLDRAIVEALLFAADEPLTPAQIKKVLGNVETSEVRGVLEAIRDELDERKAGFGLVEVAGGFQFRTRPEHGVWIRQLRSEKPPKLSKPALETLAVVSYKQPVTRAEIEAIRRVDTGAVLKTLLDRRLLKVVGTKDVPGRPALYGTSKEFLEVFRLKSLKELPTLKEIRDVAAEMGDALDVPRELLPEEVAAALPPLEEPEQSGLELGAATDPEGDAREASADDGAAHEPPDVSEEPRGSTQAEPAPSPPSAAAEED